MSPIAKQAIGADQQHRRNSLPKSRSSSANAKDCPSPAIPNFPTHLHDSYNRHQYSESRILPGGIASSNYPSSTSTSSPSLNSETFAARLGLYTISRPGSAGPRDLVVRVMDWAEDVEQYAPDLEQERAAEKTPLMPAFWKDHGSRYGTLDRGRLKRDFRRNRVATYWDGVGDRKINFHVREDGVPEEILGYRWASPGLAWWQCSLVAIVLFMVAAVGCWFLLLQRAEAHA